MATATKKAYTCPQCGHVLRVFGLGRHRVYFELGDTGSVDPVMDGACPQCRYGIAGKTQTEPRA